MVIALLGLLALVGISQAQESPPGRFFSIYVVHVLPIHGTG